MSGAQQEEAEGQRLALVLERNLAVVLAGLRHEPRGNQPTPAPLAGLLAARTAADAIEDATSLAVAQARRAGHTWHEIGQLLSITRQAAQQRFGDRPQTPENAEQAALAQRAAEIVEQLDHRDWAAVSADWNETMRTKLPQSELAQTWEQIVSSAGALQGTGRPSVTRKGPYRIADVPLVFEHGPLRAQVTFDHTGSVAGLFILLPDTS